MCRALRGPGCCMPALHGLGLWGLATVALGGQGFCQGVPAWGPTSRCRVSSSYQRGSWEHITYPHRQCKQLGTCKIDLLCWCWPEKSSSLLCRYVCIFAPCTAPETGGFSRLRAESTLEQQHSSRWHQHSGMLNLAVALSCHCPVVQTILHHLEVLRPASRRAGLAYRVWVCPPVAARLRAAGLMQTCTPLADAT